MHQIVKSEMIKIYFKNQKTKEMDDFWYSLVLFYKPKLFRLCILICDDKMYLRKSQIN